MPNIIIIIIISLATLVSNIPMVYSITYVFSIIEMTEKKEIVVVFDF